VAGGSIRATGSAIQEGEMKIVVDYDLCEANAVCMDVCPECFRVEDDDSLTILVERPPESLRKKVEEAVRLCPRQALSLKED
jgi:ferredoxin